MARKTNPETIEQWRRRITKWRKSGLSATAFSRREGVSSPNLFAWRRRLAGATPVPTSAFVPVTVVPTSTTSVELVLPTGVVLRLHDFPLGQVGALVRSLTSC